LNVEEFASGNPGINADLFVEHARVALSEFHDSPANLSVHIEADHLSARIHFNEPDPRSRDSLQRPDFIEKGAIVIAGLILNSVEGKQLSRVVSRGTSVDYFVGEELGDVRWVLEVGGTDEQSLATIRNKKKRQLRKSCFRDPPHSKDGFVSVTRFANPRCATALDQIPAE